MSLLIIILVIILALIIFKGTKHKFVKTFFTVIILTFIIFLVMTYTPLKQAGVSLKSPSGMITTIKVYFAWLGNAFGNAQDLTASAIRMNWQPKVNNSTIN
jgi:hypothetical protein